MEEARHLTTNTCAAAGLSTSTAATAAVSSSTNVLKAKSADRDLCGPASSFTLPAVLRATANESDGSVGSGSSAPPPLSLDLQRRDLTEDDSPGRKTAAASPNSSHPELLTHQIWKAPSVQQVWWPTTHGRTSSTSGGGAMTAAASSPSVVAVAAFPPGSELLSSRDSNDHEDTPLPAPNAASSSPPPSLTPRDRMDASMGSGDESYCGGSGVCSLSGTGRARLTTTRRKCGTAAAPRPPLPVILHTTEKDSRSDQGTMVTTTRSPAVATVAPGSGRPHEYNLGANPCADIQLTAATPCWASSLHDMLASSLATAAAATVTHAANHSHKDTNGAGTGSDAREQSSASRASPAQQAMREALVHILQRERVRALITRALSLWRLHHALRLHEPRRGGSEASAGTAVRKKLSPTPSVGQQDRGGAMSVTTTPRHAFSPSRHADAAALMPPALSAHPHPLIVDSLSFSSDHQCKSPTAPEGVFSATAESKEATGTSTSLLTWTPLGGMGPGVRCCGISTDEVGVYADADDEDGRRDQGDGVEASRHMDLQQRQQQRHHRDRRGAEGSSSLLDAAPPVDGASGHCGGLVIDAAFTAISMVPPLSAGGNASAKQSLSSSSHPLLHVPALEEVFSASLAQTPTAVSEPAFGTTEGTESPLSAPAVPLAETMARPASSRSDAAMSAAERRKIVVQHLLASNSPRNVSPHHGNTSFLAGGVGGSGATPSLEGSFSRQQSHSQSNIGVTVVQVGPLLRLHHPRSGAGSGAGLIASDSEDRSNSSLMHTPQGRQAGVASGFSGVWGSPRDCDSARSRSMTPLPMPLLSITTVPQVLAREAEDRLAVQAREEQRRSRLQRDMSAVMDQLMMAALRRRPSERGLHPSLRTSAVASPITGRSNDSSDDSFDDAELRGDGDGRGIDFAYACAMEAQSGSGARGSAEAIASVASAPRISAVSPSQAQPVTPWSARRRLNHNADVMDTQAYQQRNRRTEQESRVSDVTEERAWGSLSRDEEEANGMSTGLSERSMRALRSTRQWGAQVLDAIMIETGAEGNIDQVASTAPSLPPRSWSRLSHESRPDRKKR
ncbi:hypothetical protein JIQ42_08469 [Leishmania sp. Namibia]|uniref:hypothetical protein n=1 Tax=Leishmania sp. Namibia TaxID=2802991 RepID=UPI001B56998D|nr:hypothetical protein JIQ42_08469 [Leishmania sp. Namibia]